MKQKIFTKISSPENKGLFYIKKKKKKKIVIWLKHGLMTWFSSSGKYQLLELRTENFNKVDPFHVFASI